MSSAFSPYVGRAAGSLSALLQQQTMQGANPASAPPANSPPGAMAYADIASMFQGFLQAQTFSQLQQAQQLSALTYLIADVDPNTGLPRSTALYFNAFLGDRNTFQAADSSLGSWQMIMTGQTSLQGAQVQFGFSPPGVTPIVFTPVFTLFPGGRFLTPADTQNQTTTFALDTGTANTYVIALTPAITAYTIGQSFTFIALNTNTGASTLDAGAGPLAITQAVSSALGANAILAGQAVQVVYDGVQFQMTSR